MSTNGNVNKLLIKSDVSVRNAMMLLNETALKNLYVVDENNKMLGSVSDGDIRRFILGGNDLSQSICMAMNKSPRFIKVQEVGERKFIRNFLLQHRLETVPVIDEEQAIIDIIYWTDIFKKDVRKTPSKKNIITFILAGGVGTRLEPFTRILPKPLIPVGELPMIEVVMDKFKSFGFGEFLISINYKGDMIKAYFGEQAVANKYDSVRFIKEEFSMGTIGSLVLAKEEIKNTFFITNCDIIIEEDFDEILNYHKNKGNTLTLVGCTKKSIIPYGVLKTDKNGTLLGIEEKPEYNHVISTGVYVAEPEIINYLKVNTRKDITDLISELIMDGKKVGVYPVLDGQWFDMGQWTEFEQTRKHFVKNEE